jgi:glycosyltransferase involved in cell wall biosynthesis
MIDSVTVSVVLPVRNGARFLSQALDSVISQTRPPDEIIIIDGRSTDDTPAIIASYAARDPRIRAIMQTGIGVDDAYNVGITAARGVYIGFISHDDMWMPDKLAVQIAYLEANPDIDYCSGRIRFFLEEGCAIPAGFRPHWLEGTHFARVMEGIVMRRTLIARVGLFPSGYVSAGDVAWQAQAMRAGARLGEIDHLLLHRRVHDRNTSIQNHDNTRELLRALRASLHPRGA